MTRAIANGWRCYLTTIVLLLAERLLCPWQQSCLGNGWRYDKSMHSNSNKEDLTKGEVDHRGYIQWGDSPGRPPALGLQLSLVPGPAQ